MKDFTDGPRVRKCELNTYSRNQTDLLFFFALAEYSDNLDWVITTDTSES